MTPNLDALLTREQTAQALTAAGYPVKASTLSTKATRGGAPPHRVFAGKALYRLGDVLEWAESVTRAPRRRSSEPNHQPA